MKNPIQTRRYAVVIGYKIPARYAPDAYPLDLASNILAGGKAVASTGGWFTKNRSRCKRRGSARSPRSEFVWAYAIMNQGHTAEEGEKALVGVLDELKTAPVEVKELEKAKNQEISGFVLGDTDPGKSRGATFAAVIGKKSCAREHRARSLFRRFRPPDLQRVADYFESQHAAIADRYPVCARAAAMRPFALENLSRVMMKRATHWAFSRTAAIFPGHNGGGDGPSAAPVANGQEQPPAVPRSQTEPPSSQEPQKASGVVPPGVKLAPQMPGPGAPRPFNFPKAATKTLPNGCRSLW